MNEVETMRGGSILRYCSTCKNNMWHKIDMCGKCGATNTTKHKERCRCCGGLFDSLVQDHPRLQGQCEACVENYEKEKQYVSSDRYACAGCEKYFHELDLSKDKDGNLLCAPCSQAYDAGRVPKKEPATNFFCSQCKYESSWPFSVCGKCGAYGYCLDKRLPRDGESTLSVSLNSDAPNKGWRCGDCGERMDSELMCSCDKNKNKQPDNSHYTRGGIEPWTYIQANDLNFFEGSVVKYITRWRHKNGVEDLRKARVYIDELIRQEESK